MKHSWWVGLNMCLYSKIGTEKAPNLNWDDQAITILRQFVKARRKKRANFTVEDFIAYCMKKNLPMPHTNNKWGGLFSLASEKKIIKCTNKSVASGNPSAKSRRILVWC